LSRPLRRGIQVRHAPASGDSGGRPSHPPPQAPSPSPPCRAAARAGRRKPARPARRAAAGQPFSSPPLAAAAARGGGSSPPDGRGRFWRLRRGRIRWPRRSARRRGARRRGRRWGLAGCGVHWGRWRSGSDLPWPSGRTGGDGCRCLGCRRRSASASTCGGVTRAVGAGPVPCAAWSEGVAVDVAPTWAID